MSKGKKMQSEAIYAPPWRDVLPNGKLSEPFGPSLATYAKRVAEFRQWAFNRQPSKQARTVDAADVRALLLDGNAHIPDGERQVGKLVYLDGYSVRWVAKHLERSRRTVRVQLERLRDRVPMNEHG